MTSSYIIAARRTPIGKMLGQLFVQLYPHPACSRMHSHFAEAYRDASPKEVQRETSPVRIAAVA